MCIYSYIFCIHYTPILAIRKKTITIITISITHKGLNTEFQDSKNRYFKYYFDVLMY